MSLPLRVLNSPGKVTQNCLNHMWTHWLKGSSISWNGSEDFQGNPKGVVKVGGGYCPGEKTGRSNN